MVSQPDGNRVSAAQPSLWSMLVQVLYIGTIGYGGPTALTYLRNIFVTDVRGPPRTSSSRPWASRRFFPGRPVSRR